MGFPPFTSGNAMRWWKVPAEADFLEVVEEKRQLQRQRQRQKQILCEDDKQEKQGQRQLQRQQQIPTG